MRNNNIITLLLIVLQPSALPLLELVGLAPRLVAVATAPVAIELSPIGANSVYVLVQPEVFAPFPVPKGVLSPKLKVDAVSPIITDSPKLVRVAVVKKLEYDKFQADTEASTLDGTGAMVVWTEEQPEESAD